MPGKRLRGVQKIGIALLVASLCTASPAAGDEQPGNAAETPARGPVTGLLLPRFVSLKFDKVRLRHGPGLHHRIDWDYVQRRGMPVEIIAEVENWRRIRDIDGDEGWVHSSQLSDVRGVIVTGSKVSVMRRRPDPAATPVALVEPGLIGRVKSCREDWCRITIKSYTGWLRRPALWGIYAHEEGID